MPDVRRNGSMEIDLKLQGDKIKLESRPVSRESASRPVSALTLYNTPKEYAASKRPRSADDNKEPLSSAELLKSLVSQPIVSWRNGSAELSPNYKSDDDVLNAPSCQLTPGLTGKPPLPMLKREKKVGKDGNGEKEDFDEEGSRYAKELEEIASRLSEIETGANAPDNQVHYQNWITDRMVEDAEKRTDLILSQIHQQQNELIKESTLQSKIQKGNNDLCNKTELLNINQPKITRRKRTFNGFNNKSLLIETESNDNNCINKPQIYTELVESEFNLNNELFIGNKTNTLDFVQGEDSYSSLKINNNLSHEENMHACNSENKILVQKSGLNIKNKEYTSKFAQDFDTCSGLNHKSRQSKCQIQNMELNSPRIKLQKCDQIQLKARNSQKSELNNKNKQGFLINKTALNLKLKSNIDSAEFSNQDEDIELDFDMSQRIEKKSPTSISFDKFFSDVPPIDLPSEKIVTLSDRPLEKPIKHKNVNSNRKPRNGVKFSPKVSEKKNELSKGKFTAKTMRTVKDVEKTEALDEEVSWMSRPEKPSDIEKEMLPDKEDIEAAENDDDDEIAEILEVLEAESQKSQSKIQSIKKIVSTELNATINSIPPPVQRKEDFVQKQFISGCGMNAAQEVNIFGSQYDCKESVSSSSIASNNYKDILGFLDEVDKNSAQSINIAKDRIAVATKLIDGSLNLDSVPRLEDLLTHTPTQLANEVVDLNLRLKEKSSAIRTLQEELSSLREQVIKSTKQAERIVKEKLRTQKEEGDAIVRRHQRFIDQLIGEKKTLGQQCENVVAEMRMMEERFAANAKAAEHRHQVELQKMKDMHIAGEKIRRERWLDTKTQKIKEMTVKSIEPEIQSMTVRHEQELADLRSLHKREIEDIEMKNARKMQQQCETIRAQMTEEREKALAHEREVMRQRYESMVESEEKSYQDQRKRLMQEHAHRMEECQVREEAAAAEKERALKQLQDEYDDKIQSIVRRHANEVKIARESAELEMETWRNNCRKQLEMQLATKEASLREQLRKERDREIELVIERLESESNEAKTQLETVSENRIRRLKDKYEKEIKDLELSENEAKVKYAEMKGRLLENEELVIGLKAGNKNLENQLKELQELYEKLTLERQSMKQNLEQEVRVEISSLEKEIEKIKDDREAELQQVYSRVKVAVARKDETISDLSRDNASLKEKCKYLESMLEQQRKEYLIK